MLEEAKHTYWVDGQNRLPLQTHNNTYIHIQQFFSDNTGYGPYKRDRRSKLDVSKSGAYQIGKHVCPNPCPSPKLQPTNCRIFWSKSLRVMVSESMSESQVLIFSCPNPFPK